MKRVAIAELLDTDAGIPEEINASIQDLANINRWFGGISSNVEMLEQIAKRLNATRLSVLDVAAGSGEVAHHVADRLSKRGFQLDVTLLDHSRSHLKNGFRGIVGDALALPFGDSSFDVVSCNLFVHHLSPSQLLQFACEGLRVSRAVFLINDLIRSPLHLALTYAGLPLFRSRLTWHDAPASVRQAYTPKEVTEILQQIPSAIIEINRHYLFRMSVQLWKPHV